MCVAPLNTTSITDTTPAHSTISHTSPTPRPPSPTLASGAQLVALNLPRCAHLRAAGQPLRVLVRHPHHPLPRPLAHTPRGAASPPQEPPSALPRARTLSLDTASPSPFRHTHHMRPNALNLLLFSSMLRFCRRSYSVVGTSTASSSPCSSFAFELGDVVAGSARGRCCCRSSLFSALTASCAAARAVLCIVVCRTSREWGRALRLLSCSAFRSSCSHLALDAALCDCTPRDCLAVDSLFCKLTEWEQRRHPIS